MCSSQAAGRPRAQPTAKLLERCPHHNTYLDCFASIHCLQAAGQPSDHESAKLFEHIYRSMSRFFTPPDCCRRLDSPETMTSAKLIERIVANRTLFEARQVRVRWTWGVGGGWRGLLLAQQV